MHTSRPGQRRNAGRGFSRPAVRWEFDSSLTRHESALKRLKEGTQQQHPPSRSVCTAGRIRLCETDDLSRTVDTDEVGIVGGGPHRRRRRVVMRNCRGAHRPSGTRRAHLAGVRGSPTGVVSGSSAADTDVSPGTISPFGFHQAGLFARDKEVVAARWWPGMMGMTLPRDGEGRAEPRTATVRRRTQRVRRIDRWSSGSAR